MYAKRWQFFVFASLTYFGCIAFLICIVLSQQKPAVKKQTVMVPMRDGVRLATDIYLPEGEGPFPVILLRSPYDRKIGEGIAQDAAYRGYVMVIQNTRGRFGSEGENLPFEADGWWGPFDGEDTVEWLMKQPWCNGKIGTWGGSALGITQYLLAGTGTKKIVTQHITVGAPNLYHVVYWGGVFRKAMIEDWLRITQFRPEALKIWKSHHNKVWFSIFLGWLVKGLILRYGGHKVYWSWRPTFIGMVVGELMAAAIWLFIDSILQRKGHDVFPGFPPL